MFLSPTHHQRTVHRSRSHKSIFKEEFDPEEELDTDYRPSHEAASGPADMAIYPTPREVRRLASDHDFVMGANPSPRRLGWWAFLATHLSLIAAFGAGAIFIIVAIVYTSTASRQLLECPVWANNCEMADDWTVDHLGIIQGIITLIYFIGVASLAYVALALCESAVWPLLTRQSFAIRELEAYLSTTRGSVLSLPVAVMSVRTWATGLVLAAAVALTLIPLASAPLVGFAFTPAWQSVELQSNYTAAGGLNELYAQTDPPTSVLAGVLAAYHAWSTDPSSEPLSEYRDWYFDREALAERGAFTAHAVQLETTISCSPHGTQQLQRDGLWWNAFLTNMTRTNSNSSQPGDKNSSAEVWVRGIPRLTLWADEFVFLSPSRTRTTLIFAALNGTIEGGLWNTIIHSDIAGVSAIACDVDITARDAVLAVSSTTTTTTTNDDLQPPTSPNLPTLSSLDKLHVSTAAPNNTALNELLLWLTVAPLLAAPSVDGAQPTFSNSSVSSRAIPFTSSTAASTTTNPDPSNIWTQEGIQTFIRLAIGALTQTTSTTTSSSSQEDAAAANENGSQAPPITILATNTLTKKLDPSRALLLLLLPLIVLAITAALATWTSVVHKRDGIPVMRLMGPGELLKSAQTRHLRETAGTDAAKPYLPHELGGVRVRFGVDKEGIAGLAKGAKGFRTERGPRSGPGSGSNGGLFSGGGGGDGDDRGNGMV